MKNYFPLAISTFGACNAFMSGFANNPSKELQAYANQQLIQSYHYLLLTANFGSYVRNRPGFEKQFRALADKAWNNGIELIKHITKRGGVHDFRDRAGIAPLVVATALEVSETVSMAYALEQEKQLALTAHAIHQSYSKPTELNHYDPEVIFYLAKQ